MKYDVMVVGSGIAGMESSIKLGDMGYKVLLVEKEASVGGRMILLSKVFPTLDCASCISGPKMSSTINHPNITTMTYSEVKGIVRDKDGSFRATREGEGALHRLGGLHRLLGLPDGLHRGGARPVQRRSGAAPRRLHRLPPGRAEEGGHRAGGHVAVHRQLPRGHQGARLCVPDPQRQVRGGLPARPRGHAAGRHARARVLRPVRVRVHPRIARGDHPDPSAQALRRRPALRR